MPGKGKAGISWDSCVFLAYFNEESDKQIDIIEKIIKLVESKNLVMVVSTICYVEVLDKADQCDAGKKFRAFMKHESALPANVDERVGELAAQFRQQICEALERGEISRGLKAPDAIIAATAVHYNVTELHTFDPDLLALSDSPLIGKLHICKPALPGGQLVF